MSKLWRKQKREQREKHKLLSGQCPANVLPEIDKELDIEIDKNGLIDRFKLVNLTLNKVDLIQTKTTQYNQSLNKRKYIFLT